MAALHQQRAGWGRRGGLGWPVAVCAALLGLASVAVAGMAAAREDAAGMFKIDPAQRQQWIAEWQANLTPDAQHNRYCDKENGEELGWLISPYLRAFYYGYLATGDPRWAGMMVDWTDSIIKRGVKEPDGYIGWPKKGAAGTEVDNLDGYKADSLLGEAMMLRPVVLMSKKILDTPVLKAKYGDKARAYIKLAEEIYTKWDQRGAWRRTPAGNMITIVQPYGLTEDNAHWTAGYAHRNDPNVGMSHPNNKANEVAEWLLAMADATGNPKYKERAALWFNIMKGRMELAGDGRTYEIWNYWQPGGAWDYKAHDGPKHWIGVHPNPGYYEIDVEAIVDAYQHGVVFTRQDIDRLVATALADKRYWDALVPYSREIQKRVQAELKPASWGGMVELPWYLSLQESDGQGAH